MIGLERDLGDELTDDIAGREHDVRARGHRHRCDEHEYARVEIETLRAEGAFAAAISRWLAISTHARTLACAIALVLATPAIAAPVAFAGPSASRVVLADGDPELRRAVDASLKPYRIEVVVDPVPPSDLAGAEARAEGRHARFVVWREGSELVVFDHETAALERRVAQDGAFDPVSAAAAALTVKTMMRLPPEPPPEVAVLAPPPARVAPDTGGIELRLDGVIGARYEVGLDSTVALRFGLRALVRPWRDDGWRLGIAGDLGAAADVEQAGFRGTWSNWAALAVASYELVPEVEAWVGGGIEHSDLSGIEMTTPRTESATLLAGRAGVIARYRLGAFTVGAGLTLEGVANTPTYTKTRSSNAIFEVPPTSVVGGLVLGTDIVP